MRESAATASAYSTRSMYAYVPVGASFVESHCPFPGASPNRQIVGDIVKIVSGLTRTSSTIYGFHLAVFSQTKSAAAAPVALARKGQSTFVSREVPEAPSLICP